MMQYTRDGIEAWHLRSSQEPGLHVVVSPEKDSCQSIWIYRLNLTAGQEFELSSGKLEMNGVITNGKASVSGAGLDGTLDKCGSFYIPGNTQIRIHALEDTSFYIGAALWEGIGSAFLRNLDLSLPLGDIHQFHGEGVGRREVFFTLDPKTPASRLICGLTWGGDGSWTSWPPHQHELDLEEAYCYFDMDAPKFGMHLSYLTGQHAQDAVVHVVNSGSVVLAPAGYHPTVASPGTRNTYLWVLAALRKESSSYDLAITDPDFAPKP